MIASNRLSVSLYEKLEETYLGLFQNIQGVASSDDRQEYADLLWYRLILLRFLQSKGFLNNNPSYLEDQWHNRSEQEDYYTAFFRPLVFEVCAVALQDRKYYSHTRFDNIPFLPLAIFDQQPVEERWPNSKVSNEAFEIAFAVFDQFQWDLSDFPSDKSNILQPAQIFQFIEANISQQSLEGYATAPAEIAGFLCERTICNYLVQQLDSEIDVNELMIPPRWVLAGLLTEQKTKKLQRFFNHTLAEIKILDPACATGLFLHTALQTLLTIYRLMMARTSTAESKELTSCLTGDGKSLSNQELLLKQHIIYHNLFGVDLDPKSILLTRLRLYLSLAMSCETFDDLCVLPTADLNIRLGNSLIDPLHTEDIEQASNQSKQLTLFSQKEVRYAEIVAEREEFVRRLSPPKPFMANADGLLALRSGREKHNKQNQDHLDEYVLAEFKRLGIMYEQATWDKDKNRQGLPLRRELTLNDVRELRPFHWNYEFPEVRRRGGFDIIVTNPPWEVLAPNENTFFSKFQSEPGKEKLRKLRSTAASQKLLQQKEIRDAWIAYISSFPHQVQYFRVRCNQTTSKRINLYTIFTEQIVRLLRKHGMAGLILPASFRTNRTETSLRKTLFEQTRIDTLVEFENRNHVWEGLHSQFNFVLLTAIRGDRTKEFLTVFNAHNLQEIERFPLHHQIVKHSVDLVQRFSHEYLYILPFNGEIEIRIVDKLLKFSTLDKNVGEWGLKLSPGVPPVKLKKGLTKQEAESEFVPVCDGRMIEQFGYKQDEIRLKIPRDALTRELLGSEINNYEQLVFQRYQIAVRAISNSSSRRTVIGTILPPGFVTDYSVLSSDFDLEDCYYVLTYLALLNSFLLDWYMRVNKVHRIDVSSLPIPQTIEDYTLKALATRAAQLVCVSPEFDELVTEVGTSSHVNGGTDPARRAEIRAELDGLIAHVYGLTEAEFAHILSTFPLVEESVKDAALHEYRRFAPYHDYLSGNWQPSTPLIITEGKTDWMHLKAAWKRLQADEQFPNLSIELQEYDDSTQMGDGELLKMCQQYAKTPQSRPHIFIFDRDNRSIINQVMASPQAYKNWGNNVYSLALPVPPHRSAQPEISIELYYTDDELKRTDSNGRRLFLSDEFDDRTGYHLTNDLHCTDRNRYSSRSSAIIDHDVYRGRDPQNVAMTKNDFAQHILDEDPDFSQFDISAFSALFTFIEQITRLTVPVIS